MKSKGNFFYEDYRSVAGQTGIYELALDACAGDEARLALQIELKNPSNRWFRNLKTYTEAVKNKSTHKLKVKLLKVEGKLESLKDIITQSEVVQEDIITQSEVVQAEALQNQLVADRCYEDLLNDEEPEDNKLSDDPDSDHDSDELGTDNHTIYPRTWHSFYKRLLAQSRFRKTPPHEYCARCSDFTTQSARSKQLLVALNSVKGIDPEFEANTEIVTRAGGAAAGWAELRKLGTTLPNLLKHVTWLAEQRVWLKGRQLALKLHEAILQLDYGGFTDS
jgi:hypothetical protein